MDVMQLPGKMPLCLQDIASYGQKSRNHRLDFTDNGAAHRRKSALRERTPDYQVRRRKRCDNLVTSSRTRYMVERFDVFCLAAQSDVPIDAAWRFLDFKLFLGYKSVVGRFTLTSIEARILGCLLEKERITPENYPLSLNSLIAACNQSTNRDPVVSYDEKSVEAGLDSLREKKLATMTLGAGSRVPKYRHNLPDHFELNPREIALLCVLLLRGPQTPGEIRNRAERLQFFDSLEQVESFLTGLTEGSEPLVRILPPGPGQKEKRYVQLISGEPVLPAVPADEIPYAVPSRENSGQNRIETLENEVLVLKEHLQKLREEFAAFRKQFE
jgi:uncharacterized protein